MTRSEPRSHMAAEPPSDAGATGSGTAEPPRRRSLGRNTAVMALGTMLSRITGLGRVLALAYALGFSSFADTYTLANNVPNIVYELVVGGILSATLVPVFVRHFSTDDEGDAWQAVSAIFTVAIVALAVLAVALLAVAPLIIDLYTIKGSGAELADQRAVATFLLRLFVPQILLYGFISVATGLLQARERFGPPMFAPILNNLVIIGVLVALPHISDALTLSAMRHDHAGLAFLGVGTTIGVLAMAALLVPYLRSIAGGRLRWNWDLRHPAVRTVLKMSAWTVGFVIANQIALWVTLTLANGKVGVNAFLAAYMFFILPHGIFSVSVMNALQPEMTRRWSIGDAEGFREQFALGFRLITTVMVPAAIFFAVLASPLVELALQHGKLSAGSAQLTADTIRWMAVGLPGFSVFIFLTRAFQSMHDARVVFYLYALENGVNVVTALAFYAWAGVPGLAASQSLAYGVAAIAALWRLHRRADGIHARSLLTASIRIGIVSTLTGGAVIAISRLCDGSALLQVIAAILIGAVVFIVAGTVVRLPELRSLRSRAMARLP